MQSLLNQRQESRDGTRRVDTSDLVFVSGEQEKMYLTLSRLQVSAPSCLLSFIPHVYITCPDPGRPLLHTPTLRMVMKPYQLETA